MVLWASGTKTSAWNVNRKRELQGLLERHAPEQENQSLRAFAVHALTDMVQPRALRELLLKRLRRSGPVVKGVRADGRLQAQAEFDFAHYADHPKSALELRVSQGLSKLEIASDLTFEVQRKSEQLGLIRLSEPLHAGKTVRLRLQSEAAAKPIHFKSLSWQPSDTV